MRIRCFPAASLCCLAAGLAGGTSAETRPQAHAAKASVSDDLLAWVDPTIGTGGHGHAYPGATVPFGMVQLSPDTNDSGWDWCSGYHRSDGSIMGFSHTHLSGTGAADLLDVLLMPTTGELKLEPGTRERPDDGYRSRFSHGDEEATPGYYSVKLANGVRVELTASERVGLQRYTFPAAERAHVVLDLAHMVQGEGGGVLDSELRVVDDSTISGWRRVTRWARDRHVYFVARFSRPFADFGLLVGGERRPRLREARGTRLKAWVDYRTRKDDVVLVRVALSSTSVDAALANLEAEAPHADFEAARAGARSAWSRALSLVSLDGGTRKQRRIFATALYHAFLAPTLFDDVDGSYRGLDGQVHRADGYRYYSTFSLWDTYRAAHPLYALVQRARVRDMVRSLIAMAQQHPDGVLPIWPLANGETHCMIGYHAASVIAEAWEKGIRDFDAAEALRLMERQARKADYRGLGDYARLGYVPCDREGESVSKTLEYSYDDYAIGRLARALGREADAREFLARAAFYVNVLDPQTRFARPRLASGLFAAPFDPSRYGVSAQWQDYTEANAWQYTFAAQHDPAGYLRLLGGRQGLERRLDATFTTPLDLKAAGLPPDVSGLIGQYAHGNEPSHHVAYLYAWTGAPWKTQQRVRQVLDTLYDDAPDGLAGNEDCGQMSAWYVMSALGLYPVSPAGAFYVVGAPSFPKATIDLGEGRRLVIRASGASPANGYVQSARLGGRPLSRAWVTHDELLAAGEISFVMGPRPNVRWAAAEAERPPSMSDSVR